MDLKKVEKNLGEFSKQILEKIELDIKEIDQEQKKLLEEIVTLVITEWK